jgi:hypothetical protein
MADENRLVKSPKVHGPAQHAHALLAIDGIQAPTVSSRNSVS